MSKNNYAINITKKIIDEVKKQLKNDDIKNELMSIINPIYADINTEIYIKLFPYIVIIAVIILLIIILLIIIICK
jgi:hypothetical protein